MLPEKISGKEKYYQNSLLFFPPKFIRAPCSSLLLCPLTPDSVTLNTSNFQEICDSSIYQPLLQSIH